MKNFKIIPIIIGQQNYENITDLGNCIGDLFKEKETLIVASTDLSHYHPYERAATLDRKILDLVESFDYENLMDGFTGGSLEMCGGGPVISALIAAKKMGANASKILEYKNSGDVSGDRSAVVGYLSAAIYSK